MKKKPWSCKLGFHWHKKPLVKVHYKEVFFSSVRIEYIRIGKICTACDTRIKGKAVKLLPE